MRLTVFLAALGLFSSTARADDAKDTVAFRGCRLLTVAGAPIENGVLIVQKGKVVAIGPADSTPVPDGATVRDVTGMTIIPGMVDTHSNIGIYPRPHVPANSDGNEMSGPVQSSLRCSTRSTPTIPAFAWRSPAA